MGIPITKKRWSRNHLVFIMGISLPIRQHLYIEMALNLFVLNMARLILVNIYCKWLDLLIIFHIVVIHFCKYLGTADPLYWHPAKHWVNPKSSSEFLRITDPLKWFLRFPTIHFPNWQLSEIAMTFRGHPVCPYKRNPHPPHWRLMRSRTDCHATSVDTSVNVIWASDPWSCEVLVPWEISTESLLTYDIEYQ